MIGTMANRSTETRLLSEMSVELTKKHQAAILATDIDGQPKAGIVPCKNIDDLDKWVKSLKPEILFTFHPELINPSFDRIDVCVVLGKYRVQDLEKYDLICTPYGDIEKGLKSKGFYCIRVPLQANTKAFANLGLKRKYKLGMIGISPISLVNADNGCLILSNGLESFNILEWSELLEKKVTVLTEENDSTLVKFYNSIESCLVKRPDDYSTLHALACGCKVIVPEYSEIDSIGPEHIGKFPWLKLVEDYKKHIGKRDKWQKYRIIQQ